jgi:hypothetical protein
VKLGTESGLIRKALLKDITRISAHFLVVSLITSLIHCNYSQRSIEIAPETLNAINQAESLSHNSSDDTSKTKKTIKSEALADDQKIQKELNYHWKRIERQKNIRIYIEMAENALAQQSLSQASRSLILQHLSEAYFYYGDFHLQRTGTIQEIKDAFKRGAQTAYQAIYHLGGSSYITCRTKGNNARQCLHKLPESSFKAMFWHGAHIERLAGLCDFGSISLFDEERRAIWNHLIKASPSIYDAAPLIFKGIKTAQEYRSGISEAESWFDKAQKKASFLSKTDFRIYSKAMSFPRRWESKPCTT